MTKKRKLRCREPSRICSRLKIAVQKNREVRCLFKRILSAVPRSFIVYKFRQSSIRKEHVCFKYFVGISAKKEEKEEKSCSFKHMNFHIFICNNMFSVG